MAVAYDQTSTRSLTTGDQSWTHTPTGTPAGVLVLIVEEGGTDTITGVTYGGEAMSEVAGSPMLYAGAETGSIHGFFLNNPTDKDAATVAVDTATGSDQWIGACFTVTSSTGQTEVHDTSVMAGATGQTTVGATLTITKDSFVAGAMYSGLGAPAFTEVSGTTEVVEGDLGQDSGGISRGSSIKTSNFSYTWTQASDDGMALVVAICQKEAVDASAGVASGPVAAAYNPGVRVTTNTGSAAVAAAATFGGGTTYEATVLADSPTAYWRLGEPSGTNADDEVGTNDGTYTNSPTLNQTGALTGDSDTSVTFDRTAPVEYVAAGSSISFSSTGWSVECWVKRTDGTNEQFWYIGGAADASPQLNGVRLSGFQVYGYGGVLACTNDTGYDIATGGWHHVVVTKDASHVYRLYIDGVDRSVNVASPAWTTASYAFSFPRSDYEPFSGGLDEVAVWGSTTLSAAQVAAHYAAGIGGGGGTAVGATATIGASPAAAAAVSPAQTPTYQTTGTTVADAGSAAVVVAASTPAIAITQGAGSASGKAAAQTAGPVVAPTISAPSSTVAANAGTIALVANAGLASVGAVAGAITPVVAVPVATASANAVAELATTTALVLANAYAGLASVTAAAGSTAAAVQLVAGSATAAASTQAATTRVTPTIAAAGITAPALGPALGITVQAGAANAVGTVPAPSIAIAIPASVTTVVGVAEQATASTASFVQAIAGVATVAAAAPTPSPSISLSIVAGVAEVAATSAASAQAVNASAGMAAAMAASQLAAVGIIPTVGSAAASALAFMPAGSVAAIAGLAAADASAKDASALASGEHIIAAAGMASIAALALSPSISAVEAVSVGYVGYGTARDVHLTGTAEDARLRASTAGVALSGATK